jgi:hypothetical protein
MGRIVSLADVRSNLGAISTGHTAHRTLRLASLMPDGRFVRLRECASAAVIKDEV